MPPKGGKGKGKEIGGKGSSGKRKRDNGYDSDKTGGRKRKNPNVLQFFDNVAAEANDTDDSDFDDEAFFDDLFGEEEPQVQNEPLNAIPLPFIPKEEEMTEEELDKMFEERYKSGSGFVTYAEDDIDSKRSVQRNAAVSSPKDPIVWKVKCMVGRERHSAFCLMQKYVDLRSLGSKLPIISAFAVDHVKGYIYVEADKQNDVNEACKGLCSIYTSRISIVPRNEISHLLSARSKCTEVSKGMWARVKNGKYKGDLAQIVDVNNARKRATVKLIPRIDLQALLEKFGGGAVKKTTTPAPRVICSSELEEFRPLIQCRRDRETGEVYEFLDGLMLKDGYLYKKVSLDSLNNLGLTPSEDEIRKFQPSEIHESKDLEWLSQLYGEQKRKRNIKPDKGGGKGEGSSSSSMGNGFEMHDLVCFGRKDFGVIVGIEKEDYKILKDGPEGPIVVGVDPHELKTALTDTKFTALDQHKKTLAITDIVRVLEGPSKDRQGTVRQIYRGIVFLHDEDNEENGGYFCAKSHMCEKVKVFEDAFKDKAGESEPFGLGDFSSSPKSPLSPKKAWQPSENSRNFGRGDKDGMFSIGQALRIRVGPLKGYLCRVLAIRYSDVTVKLDSQQKVLTVKCEHLAEVRGKSSAFPTSSAQPFNLLGTQGSSGGWTDGTGTSADGNGWNVGGASTSGNAWPAFPTSGTVLQTEDNNNQEKDVGGAAAWESKMMINQNSGSGWGQKKSLDAEAGSTLGKAMESEGATSWGNGSSSDQDQSNNWNKPKVAGADGVSSWNKPRAVGADAGSSWNKEAGGSSLTKDQRSDWTKSKGTENQTENWGNRSEDVPGGQGGSSNGDQGSSWNKPKAKASGGSSWSKDIVQEDQSSSWNKTGANKKQTENWGKKITSENASGWGQGGPSNQDQTNNWTNSKASSADAGSAWNKESGGPSWSKDSIVQQDQQSGWKKAQSTEKWGNKCGDENTPGWGKGGSSNHDQAKNWNKPTDSSGEGRSSWNKDTTMQNDQANGWGKSIDVTKGLSENWGNRKNMGENVTGWGKDGSNNQDQTGSWSKPKASGTDGGTESWNKSTSFNADEGSSWGKKEAGGGSSWSKKEAGEGSSWGKKEPDGGSSWGKQAGGRGSSWSKPAGGSSWNKDDADQQDSWERPKTFDGGRGSGGRRARGGRGGRDQFGGGRSFGQGQASGWNKGQDTSFDGSASNWNNNQAGGWGNSKGFGGESYDTKNDQAEGQSKDHGGGNWNTGKPSNENWSARWNKVSTANEEPGRNGTGWTKKSSADEAGKSGDLGGWGQRNGNQNSDWGKSNWQSGGCEKPSDASENSGWGGNWRGDRDNSDGGGFRGRGRGRSDRGGFGGRGNNFEGRGFGGRDNNFEGRGGFGGGRRGGYGGGGRGRSDDSGGWKDGNSSVSGGSSAGSGGWSSQGRDWKQPVAATEGGGWRGNAQSGGWNKGNSSTGEAGVSDAPSGEKKQWSGWNAGNGSSGGVDSTATQSGGWNSQGTGWNPAAGTKGTSETNAQGGGWNKDKESSSEGRGNYGEACEKKQRQGWNSGPGSSTASNQSGGWNNHGTGWNQETSTKGTGGSDAQGGGWNK